MHRSQTIRFRSSSNLKEGNITISDGNVDDDGDIDSDCDYDKPDLTLYFRTAEQAYVAMRVLMKVLEDEEEAGKKFDLFIRDTRGEVFSMSGNDIRHGVDVLVTKDIIDTHDKVRILGAFARVEQDMKEINQKYGKGASNNRGRYRSSGPAVRQQSEPSAREAMQMMMKMQQEHQRQMAEMAKKMAALQARTAPTSSSLGDSRSASSFFSSNSSASHSSASVSSVDPSERKEKEPVGRPSYMEEILNMGRGLRG